MAAPISPINSNSRDTDPLLLAGGVQGKVKRGVPGTEITPSTSSENAVAQLVGTHADDGVFTPASTEPIVVIGGFADDTSPDSVSEGDAGAIRMTLSRLLKVVSTCDAAAVTAVSSQDTNINLLAANPNRIGATIYNTDTGPLYVKFGATATATTSFTVKIPADTYYEFPNPVYRGAVDGIWTSSGSGSAVITELT